MEVADLTGARAKLGRANEHVQEADREMAVVEKITKTGRMQLRRENDWFYLRMEPLPPLPQRLALVTGDCLSNIRAALDHLVWQLVLREDQKPGHRHCFPIYETRQEFIDKVELPSQKRTKSAPLYGIRVHGDAWTIIEEAQPFQGAKPQHHPLALLALLNNIDKHRMLLVQQAVMDVRAICNALLWRPDAQPVEVQILVRYFTLKEPADVLRFRFAEEAQPGMYMQRTLPVNPTVGNDKTVIFISSLKKIRLYVEQILDKCATLPRVQG